MSDPAEAAGRVHFFPIRHHSPACSHALRRALDEIQPTQVLVEGPGLRWSIQGAHMTYHLGGGEGGIRHYLDHLGPSQEKRWASLGHPQLTPEVKAAIVRGVEAEAAGRSIAELSAERDVALLQTLKLRSKRRA